TDERHRIRQSHVAACFSRPYQRTKHFRTVGISPTEVVEQGDSSRIGSDRDDVPHRFVNCASSHPVSIVISQPWIDAATYCQSVPGSQHRHDYRGISRAVVMDADQWLHSTSALDLMVVLADDPFFGADVGGTQNT